MEYLITNWEWFMLGFYIAEKAVKLTPKTFTVFGFPLGKYDDIVVDGVKDILSVIVSKKK